MKSKANGTANEMLFLVDLLLQSIRAIVHSAEAILAKLVVSTRDSRASEAREVKNRMKKLKWIHCEPAHANLLSVFCHQLAKYENSPELAEYKTHFELLLVEFAAVDTENEVA